MHELGGGGRSQVQRPLVVGKKKSHGCRRSETRLKSCPDAVGMKQ